MTKGGTVQVFGAAQTAQYEQWKASHRNEGFVGAYRWRAYSRLHRANCSSLHRPTEKPDAVRVCSTDRSAVEQWASGEAPALIPCGRCL